MSGKRRLVGESSRRPNISWTLFVWSCALALAIALAVPGRAAADVIGHEFLFAVENASMWSASPGAALNVDRAWGFSLDKSFGPSFGPLSLRMDTHVAAGAKMSLSASDGTVNIAYPTSVQVEVPSLVRRGDAFALNSAWQAGATSMTTDFGVPQFKVEFPYEINGELRASAFGYSASVWRPSASGSYSLPQLDPSRRSFSLDTPYVDAALEMPRVATNGTLQADGRLTSSGSDDFAFVSLDLDNIASSYWGWPYGFGYGESIDIGIAKANYWVDFLDLDLRLQAALQQEFSFEPNFRVRYDLENGETIDARVGEKVDISMPTRGHFGPTYDIEAEYYFDGALRNNTELNLALLLDLELFRAGGEAFIPWIKCKWLKCRRDWKRIAGGQVGPLFDWSWALVDGELGLFDETFAIGGQFPTFHETYSIKVPEPVTLVLLGVALLAFAARLRRGAGGTHATTTTRSVKGAFSALVLTLLITGCSTANVSDAMRHADDLMKHREFDEAIVEYRAVVQRNDRFGPARLKLAEAYAATGQLAAALRESVRAADLLPGNHEAQLLAASHLSLAGRFEDARARADQVLRDDNKNAKALLVRGHALARAGDLTGARAALENAIVADPTRADAHIAIGVIRLTERRIDLARAAFSKATEIEPASVAAWLALANFHMAINEVTDAERALEHVLAVDEHHQLASETLAMIYASTGRPEKAESTLKAATAGSKQPRLQFRLADFYISQGRDGEAAAVLEPMTREPSTATAARLRLAVAVYAKNRVRAHGLMDTVIAQKPTSPEALLITSGWLLAEGRAPEALERARAAVTADPKSATAHYALGMSQVRVRLNPEAVESFREAIRLNPSAAAAQVQLAHLMLRKGSPKVALALAEAALQTAPSSPDAQAARVRSLLAMGDVARAEAGAMALVKNYSESAAVQTLWGALRLRQGDTTTARRAFMHALELAPHSTEALVGITSLDIAGRHLDDARNRVLSRIEVEPGNPDVLFLAAGIFAAGRDFSRAEETLRRIIEIEPAHAEAYATLARVYVARGRLPEAQAQFDLIAQGNPKDIGARTMAALLAQAQRHEGEATNRYREILRDNPGAAVAANNLAWLLASDDAALDEALRLARSAVAILPDIGSTQHTLGWVQYRKRLPTLAVGPFERAAELDPSNSTYAYHLALARRDTGDIQGARRAALQALRVKADFLEARQLLDSLRPTSRKP